MSRRSIQGLALPLQVSNVGIDGVAVANAFVVKQGAISAPDSTLSIGAITAPSLAVTGAISGASCAVTGALTGASCAVTGAVTGVSGALSGALVMSSSPGNPTSSIQSLASGVLAVNPSAETAVPGSTSALGLGIGYSMDGAGLNETDFINYSNSATGIQSGFTFWQARSNTNALPIMYLSDSTFGGLYLEPYVGVFNIEAPDLTVVSRVGSVNNQMVFTALPQPLNHQSYFAWACSPALGGNPVYVATLSTTALTLGSAESPNVGLICPGYISSSNLVNTGPYANDAAAQAGGVPVGGLYRVSGGTNQVIQVRIA